MHREGAACGGEEASTEEYRGQQPAILRLIRRSRRVRHAPAPVRLAGTISLVLAAFALRLALEGIYNYPFLTFYPTVLATALLFGRGMAILAAVLGAGLAFWFFVEPLHGAAFLLPDRLVVFVAYVVVCWVTAAIVEATVAAVEGLESANAALATANRRLTEADAQKAALLDDINHRLKNSLHAVGGLLEADARRAVDPATRAAVEMAAARLRVLARVHERLQLNPSSAGADTVVNAAEFLSALCDDLRPTLTALCGAALRVTSEAIPLTAARAISVGLIVNELVTNAVRHAFPDGRTGIITIVLHRIGGGRLRLEVADDGGGARSDASESGGTGTRVLQVLAHQLGGSIERQSALQGTVVAVEFPEADPSQHC
jgi:two-component sensor histidine kinase